MLKDNNKTSIYQTVVVQPSFSEQAANVWNCLLTRHQYDYMVAVFE